MRKRERIENWREQKRVSLNNGVQSRGREEARQGEEDRRERHRDGGRREGEGKRRKQGKEKQATRAVIPLTFSPSVITPRIYLVLRDTIHQHQTLATLAYIYDSIICMAPFLDVYCFFLFGTLFLPLPPFTMFDSFPFIFLLLYSVWRFLPAAV